MTRTGSKPTTACRRVQPAALLAMFEPLTTAQRNEDRAWSEPGPTLPAVTARDRV